MSLNISKIPCDVHFLADWFLISEEKCHHFAKIWNQGNPLGSKTIENIEVGRYELFFGGDTRF
jgi:hypothetical protein